jgi:hypothetical protein
VLPLLLPLLLLLLLEPRKLVLQALQLAVVAVDPALQATMRCLQAGDLHGGLIALIQRRLQLLSRVLPTQPSPLQEGTRVVSRLLDCVKLLLHAGKAAAETLRLCTGCRDSASSCGLLLKRLLELLIELTHLLGQLLQLLLHGEAVALVSEQCAANNPEGLSQLRVGGLHLTLLALPQPIQHLPERRLLALIPPPLLLLLLLLLLLRVCSLSCCGPRGPISISC